jgi:hypothetical protein
VSSIGRRAAGTWKTISKPNVNLSAGKHVIRLRMDETGSVGNFNWITLSST